MVQEEYIAMDILSMIKMIKLQIVIQFIKVHRQVLYSNFRTTSMEAITFNGELGLGDKGITTYRQVSREESGLSNKSF